MRKKILLNAAGIVLSMMNENKIIFLLGGHDLEMVEIRIMLENTGYNNGALFPENDLLFFDNDLGWGAKWSDYNDVLTDARFNEYIIYGVELTSDTPLKENWKVVDHHNDLPAVPTSIEQIANTLNIKLTRKQELIAANDHGHIKALKSICATDTEIKDIRKLDRNHQGVTEEQWNQATVDVNTQDRIEIFYDFTIINTRINKFSAITDQIPDYNKLLVYNSNSICYYGEFALESVKSIFLNIYGDKNIYSGGTHGGYCNVTREVTLKEIDTTIQLLKELLKPDYPFSYHTFMFPFKWDLRSQKAKYLSYNDRTDIAKIDSELTNKKGWTNKQFTISEEKGVEEYNEFIYYHKFVRDILYDYKDGLSTSDKKFKYYEYDEGNSGSYNINCKYGQYKLNLSGISLHIYNTGVGILTFQLNNNKHHKITDIININDVGRRIYPQFLTAIDQNNSVLTQGIKNTFLANEIELVLSNGKKITEDYSNYNDFRNLEISKIPILPSFITELLFPALGNKFDLIPVMDDRMFTVCSFGKSNFVNTINCYNSEKDEYEYLKSDIWHQFVFSDSGGSTCQSKTLLKKILKKHTYDRWIDYGTIYGMCNESLVSITDPFHNFFPKLIATHTLTIYYQMAILCLAQRATMLRFQTEVTIIKNLDQSEKDPTEVSNEISGIYQNYIEFVNKLYFREVTSQIQGIEMYSQLQDVMNIHDDIKDLDGEIEELHTYSNMLEQANETKAANKLNKVVIWFLPPTLLFGIFGGNFLDLNTNLIWGGVIDFTTIYWILSIIIASLLISVPILYSKVILNKFRSFKIKMKRNV